MDWGGECKHFIFTLNELKVFQSQRFKLLIHLIVKGNLQD